MQLNVYSGGENSILIVPNCYNFNFLLQSTTKMVIILQSALKMVIILQSALNMEISCSKNSPLHYKLYY